MRADSTDGARAHRTDAGAVMDALRPPQPQRDERPDEQSNEQHDEADVDAAGAAPTAHAHTVDAVPKRSRWAHLPTAVREPRVLGRSSAGRW